MLFEPAVSADPGLLLSKIAQGVNARGLSVPAVFFLEMYKPLTGVAQAVAAVSAPLAAMLFGPNSMGALQRVLESRENVEKLIVLIEAAASRPEDEV